MLSQSEFGPSCRGALERTDSPGSSFVEVPAVTRPCSICQFRRAQCDVSPQYFSIQFTTSLIISFRGIECDVS